MIVKPFIKWAGGKTQLLPEIKIKYPSELGKSINKYCEPFIGGGAVLFDILSNYKLEEVLINDINVELTNTYKKIKNNLHDLIDALSNMQEQFWELDMNARKEYYYEKRDRFNYLKMSNDEKSNTEKAVLFIFLNKTCFNGLFRVNKKGFFNVPIGSYKKPLICDTNNLKNISRLLQNVKIKCGDYRECESFIDENTFVYIDPPYRPLTETSNFTSYAEIDFNDDEQIELCKFVDKISSKGAKVVVSNSDPKNVNEYDDFFDELYYKYKIDRVNARRMINRDANSRGIIKEILISNYNNINNNGKTRKGDD